MKVVSSEKVDPQTTPGVPLPRRSRRRRVLVRIALVALGLLIVDGIYVLFSLTSSLDATAQRLRSGAEHLRQGQLDAAQTEFTTALLKAGSASSLANHPAFEVALRLPFIDGDAGAAEALSEASLLVSKAGLEVVKGGREAGIFGDEAASAVYKNGRVQLDAIERLRPSVQRVRSLLTDAANRLRRSPTPSLSAIADALALARSEVRTAMSSAAKAEVLVDALPGLLADGSRRTYLLAFQTPSEARGSGGLMGFYGVLEATNGRIDLVHVGPVGPLTRARFDPVAAPNKWFGRRYRTVYALRQFQQTNSSPHFPSVAEVWLRMFEAATGQRLDGVVAMDPIALGLLTRGTGPLRSDELDVEVGPGNAAKVILHDSYLIFDDDEAAQERFLGDLIDQFWQRLNGPDVDGGELVRGVAEAVETKHFKVFTRRANEQQALAKLDATGNFETEGDNIQLVFNNNAVPSKVDYFLRRTIDTQVTLTEAGRALVTTTVTLRNTAPSGPPSLLLGPNSQEAVPLEPGANRMFLDILFPKGSHYEGFYFNETFRLAPMDSEAGYPVAWELLTVPPGETTTLKLEYSSRRLADIREGGGSFDMTLVPQTTVFPDRYSFTLIPPIGYAVVDEEGNESKTFESRGLLDRDAEFHLRLVGES